MTDPVTLGLAVVAGGIGLYAGWLQWPSAPDLDGERWFKITLATLLLGEVDARQGTEESWIELVRRWVPYHPAGRLPERKVVQPLAELPGERLPGEVALQEKLAAVDGLQERWAWLYDDDPVGLEAKLADPFDLGDAYDPEQQVGPGNTWEALSKWGAGETAFRDALLRRTGGRWAFVGGRPDHLAGPSLGQALDAELPELLTLPWEDGEIDERVSAIRKALMGHAPNLDDRLILVAEEAGAVLVLRALQSDVGLRDRLLAVVAVGGAIGGRPAQEGPFGERDVHDWMQTWFTLDRFDSELVRLTPYLSVQWLDRGAPTPGSAGLPLQAQRFPEPADDGVMATLEAVDLGPLPADPHIPVEQVARAVIATTCLWTLTRG